MIQVQKIIQIIFILPAKSISSTRSRRIQNSRRSDYDYDDSNSEDYENETLFPATYESRSRGKC